MDAARRYHRACAHALRRWRFDFPALAQGDFLMACLDRGTLEQLVRGHESGEHRAHLEHCAVCAGALEQAREESKLDELRRAIEREGGEPRRIQRPDSEPEGFQLLRLLGSGGQGEVYEALQVATGRRVALKLLSRGRSATPARRARFEREVRIAARLSHPGLATVYQAGESPDGTAFLAMELVRGRHWDQWTDAVRAADPEQAPRRILAAFARLCEAVACAHAAGVVHRDIKPSNVVVDARGRPRLLDLGLAKLLERDDLAGLRTETGEFLGSLCWAPPERLNRGADARFASDVYSLGLLLHRGLTGRHAYPLGGSVVDVVVGVQSLPEALRGPYAADPRLDEACLAVLSRALGRAPSERPRDAAVLARAVRAVLGGARMAPPRRPRGRKRTAAWGGVLLVALASGWAALRPSRASPSASAAFLAALRAGDRDGQQGLEAFLEATRGAARTGRTGSDWSLPEEDSDALDRWRLAACQTLLRMPAVPLLDLGTSRRWTRLATAAGASRLALLDAEGRAEIVDLAPALSRWGLELGLDRPVESLQLAPRGDWACLAYGGPDGGGLWIAEVAQPQSQRVALHLPGHRSLGWASRAPWLVHADAGAAWVAVLDMRSGAEVARIDVGEERVRQACVGDGDGWMLIQLESGEVRVVELPSGRELARETGLGPQEHVCPLERDLWACVSDSLSLLDRRSAGTRLLHRFSTQPTVRAARDGSVVAALGRSLRRFRPARHGRVLEEWIVEDPWTCSANVLDVGTLREGRALAVLGTDGALGVLDLELDGLPRVLGAGEPARTFLDVFARPAGRGWVACQKGSLVLFEPQGQRELAVVDPPAEVFAIAGTADDRACFGTRDGRIGVVGLAGAGGVRWLHGHEDEVSALDVDPGDRLLASADRLGVLRCTALDGSGESARAQVDARVPRVSHLAWDAAGEWIAAAVVEGRVAWWRPGEAPILSEPCELSATRCVAFHPLSGELVSGHDGGALAVWEPRGARPREVHQVPGSEGSSVWALDFDPQGRFLAVGSRREVAVWDWEARRPLFAARGHDLLVFALAFHPELPVLASAAQNGELFEWDFRTGDVLLGQALGPR